MGNLKFKRTFIVFLLMICTLCGLVSVNASDVFSDCIGIGGGGAFFEPLIDPTDSDHYVVFSDMNNIYHSFDGGNSFTRTVTWKEFKTGCFSDDGTLFVGGGGIYVCDDDGENYEMIYPHPDTVKTAVSILGVNNLNIKATGYDNGYTVCMTIWEDRVYFITIDWTSSHNMKIMSCLFDGDELVLYDYVKNAVDVSPRLVNYNMVVDETGLYYSNEYEIIRLDLFSGETEIVYEARGTIADFKKAGEYYYILDDTDEKTYVTYTEDFLSYEELTDKLTLSNTFKRYGKYFEFDWHFKYISIFDTEHIYLVHYSEVDWGKYSGNDIGGILKFDGEEFTWVYDAINNNHAMFDEVGWGYHNYSKIYGVCADPNDGDHCIVTDASTVYDMYCGDDVHTVKSLHSEITYSDGVRYEATTGLDCQTTYSVKTDPFDDDHILICTTDIGLQVSYDGGESFRRMYVTYKSIENTCYDIYFDKNTEGLVYGLWSSRHDAPNTLPALSDKNATGGFGISYDGGITWDYTYGDGIPQNSIPVKMYVVEGEDELVIGVATYNNGFYISYDSGRNFESISGDMDEYHGMIWGEDIVIIDDCAYCLTSYHTLSGDVIPSVLYKVDLHSGKTDTVELGEIVIARSLTYSEEYGLYVNVIPYYYYGWISEIGASYFVNYGGGVYRIEDDFAEIIFEIENGTSGSAFDKNGTMYVAGDKGTVYYRKADEDEFSVYAENLHRRLKNVSVSNDGEYLYITTFGGGTYRMPTVECENDFISEVECVVTFIDYDGEIISEEIVCFGEAVTLPDAPTREPDRDYHYEFAGWDIDSTEIYEDTVVYAMYIAEEHNSAVRQSEDMTHVYYCTECGCDISEEDCVDFDGDGSCDECGRQLSTNVTKFTKETYFENGEQYLIANSGYVLRASLTAESVSLTESDGEYVTEDEISEDMLWTYRNGLLYTSYNGDTLYLTAYRGFGASAYTLSVEKYSYMASFWSFGGDYLYTFVNDWGRRTIKYLSIDMSGVSLLSYARLNLYRLED